MNKEFFQRTWGPDGYYENFSYGVGIDKVCEVSLYPFFSVDKIALEIGSGGGAFTERMHKSFMLLIAQDVIKMPEKFKKFYDFQYVELPDNTYDCKALGSNTIDFCFCYNVFCHLSHYAIAEYIEDVNRVLKSGGDFIFMLSKFSETEKHLPKEHSLQLGDLTPTGHYYQDERTLGVVIGEGWEVISPNMIPEHRDIIVHLKKK